MATVTGTGSNPGEVGVFGESQEAEGVRGSGHKGAGVSGTSENWVGVYGESQEAEGVRGLGHKGAGVSGTSENWHGVYGETESTTGGAGIWGENKGAGNGVVGVSHGGVGVYGKGGRIAGFFEGDVEVTGAIFMGGDTVNSLASWITRIRQLEEEVADLRSRLSSSGPPSDPIAVATVGVDLTLRPGSFSDLRIFGSGFDPNEPIEITVSSKSAGESTKSTSTTPAAADSSGKFSKTVGVSCSSTQQTTHTAYARGVSSGRISNRAADSC